MTPTQDRPAAELDSQLNTPVGGRTQAPVSASPRGAAGRVAAVPPRAAAAPHSSRPRAAQRAAGTGNQHAAKVIAAAMSEAKLEEHVRAACKQLGILRFHVRISRGTTPGLPDDILIGARGMLWRECKTQKGKPTPAQISTGEALTAAGQDWGIWRPEDWLSGRVVRELTRISSLGRPG